MGTTHSPTPFLARFGLDDAVRLLDSHDDVLAGSVGRVLGTFPRPTEITYVVSFVDTAVHVPTRSFSWTTTASPPDSPTPRCLI